MSEETRTNAADELGGSDLFADEAAANPRAEILGCSGSHEVALGGQTFYRSCESEEAWQEALKDPGLVGGNVGLPAAGLAGGGKSLLPENLEQRNATLELRETPKGRKLVGYAAVFDAPYMVGDFEERIDPKAFARSLEGEADVRAMIDHDAGRILGRTKAGTLRLEADKHGLRSEIDLPNTQEGRDIAELVRRGDLDGMSFGFVTHKDSWEESRDGGPRRRTIHDVELFDVSVVAFPANDETSIALRKKPKAPETQEVRVEEPCSNSGDPTALGLLLDLKLKNSP